MHTKAIFRTVAVLLFAALLRASFEIPNAASQGDDEDSCTIVAEAALERVGSACAEMGRNEACYGHFPISVELLEDAHGQFEKDGDLIDLIALQSLQTSAADPETGEWGIALMTVQADLPDDSDESMTFVLFGDTEIESAVTESNTDETPMSPMQAITISNGDNESCSEAPDGLLVRSPDGQRARINVNGIEMTFSSIGFLHAQADGDLRLVVLEGEVVAESLGRQVRVGENEQITVPLNGLLADGVPTDPIRIDPESVQLFSLLQDIIRIIRENRIGIFVVIFPDTDDDNSETPMATANPDLPPDRAFEVHIEAGFCDGDIEAGQVVRFGRGVGRWETEAEASAELAGATAIIILDGVQLPITEYEGLTIHTGGGDDPGYGNRAFTYWIATSGEHTISGEWSVFGSNDLDECTFIVE